jgi:putative NIF3 family GTP cyclohydrolase 1 type 2
VVITSDIKWSTQITATEMNIKLIQVPHSIEQVMIYHLQKLISNKLNLDNVLFEIK